MARAGNTRIDLHGGYFHPATEFWSHRSGDFEEHSVV